jgi:hypothetical protein
MRGLLRRKKIDPPCEPHHTRSPEKGVDSGWPEVDVMMIAKRDYRFWCAGAPVERLAMIAKRDYRSTWRPGAPAEWQDRDNPYELFAVGLWSVVGVALTTLLTWLALGGEL